MRTSNKEEIKIEDKNLVVLDHPLIEHKLSILRDKKTSTKEFREIISELAILLCYEATKNIKVHNVTIKTPLEEYETQCINEDDFAFVPILRAGTGMLDGLMNVMPNAKIGHIGLYRDEKTLKPVEYFCKLPKDIDQRDVFVVDPMLATGGSAIDAISQIKIRNPRKITFMCTIAAPEGIKALRAAHPDVDIYCAACDSHLNEIGYIVPGVGDAGDRIFGTK